MIRHQISTLTIGIALAIAFLAGRELNTNLVRAETNQADDTRLKQLLKQRLEVREKALKVYSTPGIASKFEIFQARIEVLRAQLELCDSTQQRIGVFKQIVEVEKQKLDYLMGLKESGSAFNTGQILKARIEVLRAQLDLCENKQQRITVLEQIVEVEKQIHLMGPIGCSHFEIQTWPIPVIEAEIALEREKLKP